MVLNMEEFVLFYSRISDGFRSDHDRFFSQWRSIARNLPRLNELSRKPYVRTKLLDGYDAIEDDPLKGENIAEINKFSRVYGLDISASMSDSVQEIELKAMDILRRVFESEKYMSRDDLNKVVNRDYLDKYLGVEKNGDIISVIFGGRLVGASVRVLDWIERLYEEILRMEFYVKAVTENRCHISTIFSGRVLRLINGEFDELLIKRLTAKKLGFDYKRHADIKLMCRLVERVVGAESEFKVMESSMAKGVNLENKIAGLYEALGYEVLITSATGDFGVDIIAKSNSEKIGIQCKNYSYPVGVDAIMQVYSGGKFYDCTRWCVVATEGYTDAAVEMANKLGVEILIHRKA